MIIGREGILIIEEYKLDPWEIDNFREAASFVSSQYRRIVSDL